MTFDYEYRSQVRSDYTIRSLRPMFTVRCYLQDRRCDISHTHRTIQRRNLDSVNSDLSISLHEASRKQRLLINTRLRPRRYFNFDDEKRSRRRQRETRPDRKLPTNKCISSQIAVSYKLRCLLHFISPLRIITRLPHLSIFHLQITAPVNFKAFHATHIKTLSLFCNWIRSKFRDPLRESSV